MPPPTRSRRPQMVLDLPDMVADELLPIRQVDPGGSARPVSGVSLGEESRTRERRAHSAPLAAATRGMVRESTTRGIDPGRPRKGVHIVRHMLPFWQAPVDDLLSMIDVYTAGALAIYGEPSE